jgi:uncharacterized phage protein (TIGR02220 family)
MRKNITLINEEARRQLDITRDDYALCAYVLYRQADPRKVSGWCADTKEEIADFIGISRPGLYKMVDRLERLSLIFTDPKTGYLQATAVFIDADNCKQSLHRTVNKVYTESGKSVNKVTPIYKVKGDINNGDIRESAALPLRVEIFEPSKTEYISLETENNPPPPVAPAPPAPRKKPGSRTAAELEQVGEVVEYLNTQAGTRYRANTGETAKLICGRLKDGYTVEDLKNVVAYKCVQWLGTDMQVHLCPATLFRPANFEKYYNAAKMPAPKAKQEAAPVGTPSALPNVRRL